MVWRDSPRGGEGLLDPEAEQERRLAAQARAGADWALAALVARYQPAVTRYLTRLIGDPKHARELAEQVFQRMEGRLHGPHGADNLRLWLLRASTETGLETLRHPRRNRPPLLGATPIAGLLASETTTSAQAAIRDGVNRIRGAMGAVARQARPLIWQSDESAQRQAPQNPPVTPPTKTPPGRSARPTPLMSPVDQTLDSIDPREEFRHKLIRLTLADLAYGDAQCLALHLVAGLNQAEVARALGLTNSAARKRIVQGLGQFSARYQEAVRSLGLPDEVVYGDTLSRRAPEPAPIIPEPEPAPVIVPEMPDEADDIAALGEMAAPQLETELYSDEAASVGGGTMYYQRTTGDLPEFPTAGNELFAPAGEPESATLYPEPPDSAPFETSAASAAPDSAPLPEQSNVTRIASDAIVGPVVDALPVHSEPLTVESMYGEPTGPSEALAYELRSSENDTSGASLNWVDSTDMLAPLSFEAVVSAQESDPLPDLADDPWARSVVLEFAPEELAVPTQGGAPLPFASERADADDADSTPAIDHDHVIADRSSSLRDDMSIALDEGDYGWERSRQSPSQPEVVAASSTPSAWEAAGADNASHAEGVTDTADARRAPVTRSLEELWDEAADL